MEVIESTCKWLRIRRTGLAASRKANLELDQVIPAPARDRRCKGISGPAKGILGDAWHPSWHFRNSRVLFTYRYALLNCTYN